MSKKIADMIEIELGDSLLVVGSNGKLKQLILPEYKDNIEESKGTKKVTEILELFEPNAGLKVYEQMNKRKMN